MTTSGKTLDVLLVENNAYDRAVLDACFMFDSRARLTYTTDEEDAPLGPAALWRLLSGNASRPDLVLFDLALTPWCGRVMTELRYRRILGNASPALRLMDQVLRQRKHEARWSLAEVTIAIRAAAEMLSNPGTQLSNRTGRATDLLSRTELRRLADKDDSGELTRGLERASEFVGKGGNVALSLQSVITELWGGEAAAWEIAKAPSVLRFFACATSFPDVCFAVVSHFADEDARLALRTILGARCPVPWPSERDSLLNALIINKAELFRRHSEESAAVASSRFDPLPTRLRSSLQEWQTLGSPGAMTAPFSGLPVTSMGGVLNAKSTSAESTPLVSLTRSFEEWCREILPAAVGERETRVSTRLCTMLLDETLLIAGGDLAKNAWAMSQHSGWAALIQNPFIERRGTLQEVTFEPGDTTYRLYIVGQPANREEVNEFLNARASGAVPAKPCCVVVGYRSERVALLQGAYEQDHVQVYRVLPRSGWFRGVLKKFDRFHRTQIAWSLVDNLRIRDSEGKVHRFGDLGGIAKRKNLIKNLTNYLLDEEMELHASFEALVGCAADVEKDLQNGHDPSEILAKRNLGVREAHFGGTTAKDRDV